jgi:hypothetical protein
MNGQQTYGDACECYIFIPSPGESKGTDDGKGGPGKSGRVGIGKGSGERGKGGQEGRDAVGKLVLVQGRMDADKCLCGPTGAIGERGSDAKGTRGGQRIVRP